MKSKFVLLPVIFILVSLVMYSQTNSYTPKPKIYAVIVGISTYKDADIPNLKYPEKDAVAFYEFLRSGNAGAVPEEDIALLTGPKATRNNILKEVIDKFTRSNKEDLIIFYFSGHGKAGEFENTGYLLNYDSENANEAGSALAMEEVKNKIDKCQAKMKISYIDACHAGLFKTTTKGTLEEDNRIIVSAYLEGLTRAGNGNVSFLASSARQQSLEDDKLGHGVFTYYLLQGLKGEADKEQEGAEDYNNGIVTASELATYLTNKIQSATKYKQKPTIDGDYDEFFPLSVLRSNISIANEIAKRPVKKIEDKVDIKKKTMVINDDPCEQNKHGVLKITNKTNTDVWGNTKIVVRIPKVSDPRPNYESDYFYIILEKEETKPLEDLKVGNYEYEAKQYSPNASKGWNGLYGSLSNGQIKIEKCKTTELVIR